MNHHHDVHDHDHGLGADLERLIRQQAQRRGMLRWLLAGGAAATGASALMSLTGCGGGGGDAGSSTASTGSGTTGTGTAGTGTTGTGTTGTTTGSTTCSLVPEETAGPYPGDGSNGANALVLSGIVRSDIRSSLGGPTGVASGVPLTVKLTLVNTASSCASLAGYAIYLWHCDALGRYSMYSSGITAENYLRGVQTTDDSGTVSFTTIYPGCYDGRVPHIHFEVYRSSSTALSWTNKLRTSQLAFPVATSQAVYAGSAYTGSAANLARVSFASDGVFSDGYTTQLATITGDTSSGFVATLQIGISA